MADGGWGDPDFMRAIFESLPAHMRPKGVLEPPEARQKANQIRRGLFASWNRLRPIVIAHEEVIQKRWKKRTAVKRKQLLAEIDPQLPKEHAPEISALNADDRSTMQQRRNDFLLPYLNLEDLSVNNGIQFLGLLHARAHHFPSEFAWFDSQTLGFGVVAGGVERYHGMNCTMVAFGDETTYGKVLEYSEPLDEADKTSPDGGEMEFILRESMTFGDGLAVLETQAKLLTFLLAVVSKILSDVDLTHLTPAPPLSAPTIPILNSALQWQSSARLSALRPYGLPPVFSIDEIAAMMEAQYELAAQHLADLRTDPMYLAETIQSYYDHRIETIHGKAPPSLVQSRAVSLMLTDVYSFLALYHVAKSVIDDFRVVEARFSRGPARARELPPAYEDSLKKLFPVLALLEHCVTKSHHQTMCASLALRVGLSIRGTDAAFAKHEMTFSPQPGDKLYTFMMILLQEDQTHLWQVARVFDQLDRITQDPVAHQRISPLIANLLSHWGIVNDCKSILSWHRPAVESTEPVLEATQQRLQKWHSLIQPILAGVGPHPELAAKTFPVTKFIYPKGPRNASWADKCCRVDDAFAAFWADADRLLAEKCGDELFALGLQVAAPFAVARTDWAALAMPKPVQRTPSPAAFVPFGATAQSAAAREEHPTAVKTKSKTRGVATAESADIDSQSSANISVPAPTAVPAKVYKVFTTLFNANKDEEVAHQQSSVAWKDIQTAFVQLGFELHKTRSSAWTFRHADGPKSVTVHEPHPDSTMRFWEARRFGRRLTKRFGWTLESFVLDS